MAIGEDEIEMVDTEEGDPGAGLKLGDRGLLENVKGFKLGECAGDLKGDPIDDECKD